MPIRTLIAVTLGLFCAAAAAQVPDELPLRLSGGDWLPLYERADPRLQARLEQQLRRRPEWQALLKRRQLAVGLVDLSDPERPRFARVNGRTMMYAASLPKIAILLAAFDQIHRDRLQLTDEIAQDLAAMIRVSDNGAATRMIDRIGGLGAVNAILASPEYRLYDDTKNGGLWVGKRYAKTGGREPDPLHGISHGATVTQVCRFYYLLATGRLIDHRASRQMLEFLSDPALEHKFVKILRESAPESHLFRKSGTWKHWHSDSVLVWGPDWRRYILVALVESPKGEQILQELVGAAERALQPEKPRRPKKTRPAVDIHEAARHRRPAATPPAG